MTNDNIILRRRKIQGKQKSEVPVTIEWKNSRMIRTQSIKVASHEILSMTNHLDVVKVNIVGNPGTGKSTLAETLAHLLHAESTEPFMIKILTRDDLADFKKTIAELPSTNHILIFDDISFMSAEKSNKQILAIQQAFTEIRHIREGVDIKVITIFNFHYTMAVSKYLRQSNAHFYTTIGSSDIDNTCKLVGEKYRAKILSFMKLHNQAISTSKFSFQLGNKGKKFIYDYRQPFAPIFYYNGHSARYVVFPKRTWISPLCPICSKGKKVDTATINDIQAFDDAIKTKFGANVIKQALRIALYVQGISTYNSHVKRALTFTSKWIEKNNISYEMLADFYDLKVKETKLRVDPAIFEPKDDKS